MSDMVTKLHILSQDGKSNIFNDNTHNTLYVIPLYQRAFAWGEKQLRQLVEDIDDADTGADYHLGSLIVYKHEKAYEVVDGQEKAYEVYEVVDGQQRLTALFLLLNCLGVEVTQALQFDCREKSDYTLKHIQDLLHDNRTGLDMDTVEEGIRIGTKILQEKLQEIKNEQNTLELFIEKLKRVVLYRIEVPEHTDLNRYFEIMNTRGEQLEQHDILKATLMGYLSDTDKDTNGDNNTENADSKSVIIDKEIFAKIWEACSDMTGYVQMHFNSELRNTIFGEDWAKIPSNTTFGEDGDKLLSNNTFGEVWHKISSNIWDEYRKKFNELQDKSKVGDTTPENTQKEYFINDIIKLGKIEADKDNPDDEVRVRFESIIDFPVFLLHTLKVMVSVYNICYKEADKERDGKIPLDDKSLTASFMEVIDSGSYGGKRISENKADFVKDFILFLLRTRFLFDKYIIKREFANDDAEGVWSMKTLKTNPDQKKDKKAYYINTWNYNSDTDDNKKRIEARKILMLQSALRVSYTSPKNMHWITELLICLWKKEGILKSVDMDSCANAVEKIAIKAVRDWLDNNDNKEKKYAMGVNTPHIVFNYLDFLLWSKYNYDERYKDFKFEFRNSVEHWYPQHPSEGTFEKWEDGVDQFGNLCLVQRNINSKFSNMSPEAKKTTYREMINKGSLKLRLMSYMTEKNGDQPASIYWKDTLCKLHGEEMLQLLKTACDNSETSEEDVK